MGMTAEVLAIGPFSALLIPYLTHPPDRYASVQEEGIIAGEAPVFEQFCAAGFSFHFFIEPPKPATISHRDNYMTAEDVAALVKQDLESGEFDNWHGITKCNIDALLIRPVLEQYEDS
jgi:hypothetical protein